MSQHLTTKCGVPQGSILRPILFLLYINDLPSASELLPIIFADDTNLFCSGHNADECIAKVTSEAERVVEWVRANRLSLNVDKTQYMVFQRGRSIGPQNCLAVDGKSIERVTSMKFLGVIVDEKLSWEHHVAHIRKKIARSIGMICSVRPLLNQNTLVKLYHAFIRPYLTYCLDIWGCCSKSHFLSIFKSQKRAIRIISFASRRAHTHELFQSLKSIYLNSLYILSVASLMFKEHVAFCYQ